MIGVDDYQAGIEPQTIRGKITRLVEHRYFVPVCVILSGLVRLLWIGLVHADQVYDWIWYYQRGVSIASGHGYYVDGIPTAYWPVGYPGFLGGALLSRGPARSRGANRQYSGVAGHHPPHLFLYEEGIPLGNCREAGCFDPVFSSQHDCVHVGTDGGYVFGLSAYAGSRFVRRGRGGAGVSRRSRDWFGAWRR